MSTTAFILLFLVLVVVTYAAIAVTAGFRLRGTRVITCPETIQSAAVEVDTEDAALSSLFGNADLRLKSCSRWPDRKDCDQPCVAQIKAAPRATLASAIFEVHSAGKRCAICRQPIPPAHANEPKPGLLEPWSGRLLKWSDIKPETLPDALNALQPVCENCFVVETFRREYPDLVTERPTRPPMRTH